MDESYEGVILGSIYKFRGTLQEALHRVKQDLCNWHDRLDITCVYIGKTSAVDETEEAACEAMKKRIDETKRDFGTKEMVLLYITSDENDIKELETKLIKYNMEQGDKCGNIKVASSGRPTSKKWHVLYAALAFKPKSSKSAK